jgi:general secretion pathway protein D
MAMEGSMLFLRKFSWASIALGLSCVSMFGRFPQPDGPPGPESLLPPGYRPVEVASAVPSDPPPGFSMVERFFFVEESLDQVLFFFSELTGKRVLTPNNLPNQVITFDSQRSLSREDAIVAIESLLQLNGISIAELGDTFIRVVPSNSIRFKSPSMVEGSTLLMTPSERVVSKVFEFNYLKMEEATTVLGNLLTQGVGYLEPLKTRNACLITDSLVNLQRMERLLSTLDVASQNEMIILSLRHLRATELQKRLKESVDGSLKPFIKGVVSIEADDRTNHVVMVTNPENKPMLERLVQTWDGDVDPLTKSEVIYLKHAQAEKVVPIIESLITGQKSQSQSRGSGSAAPPLPDVSRLEAASPQNEQDSGSDSLRFSSSVSLVADDRSNAVLIYGTESDLRHVREVIASLDVLLPQVRVDVVITEVTLTHDNSRGIERFGVAYDENDEITFKINENSGLPINVSGSVGDFILRSFTVRNFTLATVFDTAKKDANVRVVSAPTLVTTHNREAIINAGESRPVITSSNTDSTGLSTRSQVQFKDIGVQLKVKPLIGSNNMVQMEIHQTVENVVDEVLIDGNSQPVIGKREATSFVSVSSGEVVILGGLQERNSRDTNGRLGFFGSIPVVGRLLFSSKRNNQTTRELIIFIKPTVFNDSKAASASAGKVLATLDPELGRVMDPGMQGVLSLDTGFQKDLDEANGMQAVPEEKRTFRVHHRRNSFRK